MIFLLCLMIGGLLLTWFLEDYIWEEELEMRRLVKESRKNERRRMMHRNSYCQYGWIPPRQRSWRGVK